MRLHDYLVSYVLWFVQPNWQSINPTPRVGVALNLFVFNEHFILWVLLFPWSSVLVHSMLIIQTMGAWDLEVQPPFPSVSLEILTMPIANFLSISLWQTYRLGLMIISIESVNDHSGHKVQDLCYQILFGYENLRAKRVW